MAIKPYHMKRLKILALLIFITITTALYAQVPGAYQAGYNRMMSDMAINMARDMHMLHMLNYMNAYNGNNFINLKHEFRVVMKDGSVLNVKSKILADTVAHSNYLLYVNKDLKKDDPKREQKIYPSQTKEISRLKNMPNQFSSRFNQFAPKVDTSRVTGIAADSCWLFKVLPGKLSAYSFLSEPDVIYVSKPIAMQLDKQLVEKLTPEALEAYVKDNEKAYKAFLKKDYYKAIKQFNANQK